MPQEDGPHDQSVYWRIMWNIDTWQVQPRLHLKDARSNMDKWRDRAKLGPWTSLIRTPVYIPWQYVDQRYTPWGLHITASCDTQFTQDSKEKGISHPKVTLTWATVIIPKNRQHLIRPERWTRKEWPLHCSESLPYICPSGFPQHSLVLNSVLIKLSAALS